MRDYWAKNNAELILCDFFGQKPEGYKLNGIATAWEKELKKITRNSFLYSGDDHFEGHKIDIQL